MDLRFSIKSSTHYIAFLRRLIGSLSGLDHRAKTACSLALVEAVNNAIFHAHGRDENTWIDIAIRSSKRSVAMEVSDRGGGFTMPDQDTPRVDQVHGRGIFIIETLMDEVKYKIGRKNRLKMVYYL